MTETREVNTEDEGEDLIPKDQLPTDPAELGKTPEQTPAEPPKEEPKPDAPPAPVVPDPSPGTPAEKPVDPSQPAPVEGETSREKALRLEVQRLKGLQRQKEVKEIADGVQSPAAVEDKYKALRDQGYTDEEIAKMETAVDLIASAKGYVRADRSYAQTVQDSVDGFTEDHPEYKPTNDPDDARWNLFQSLLKDGTYNLSGKTPKQLKSIFDKVDADVRRTLGEPVTIKPTPTQVAAQQHKVQVASHAGGSKPTPSSDKPKIDPKGTVGGVKLVGFDEEDFA